MLPLISACQWSALKMRCVSGWEALAQSYLKEGGRWGGGTVAGEEPVDGLDIGFLVELGWASLIIATGRTGQFALLLLSRMLKFLFLGGPVMYLKHMGTPATICPKSHNPSTFLTMCHLGGEQREGEEGGRDGPVAAERGSCQPPLRRGLQRKFQCWRTLCVSAEHCHHLWREWGVRRPCVSRGRRVCLVLAGEFCLFDFTYFYFYFFGLES